MADPAGNGIPAWQKETSDLRTSFAVLEAKFTSLDTAVKDGFATFRSDLLRVLQEMSDRNKATVQAQAADRAQLSTFQAEISTLQLEIAQLVTKSTGNREGIQLISNRMTQLNKTLPIVQQEIASLKMARDGVDQLDRRCDKIDRKLSQLEVVSKIVTWIGIAFAGSLIGLLWAIFTGSVQLVFQ